MPDAWRAYLEMALGLTEAPRKKAQQVAGELVNRGGATAGQLQGLVEDLLSAGVANREALTNIVRYEVDKALGVVGLATVDEVSELTTRVRDLEKRLRDAQARAAAAEGGPVAEPGVVPGGARLEQPAPLPRKAVKKAVAKKAVKSTPNAMPSAGRTPAAPPPNAASAIIGTETPTPGSVPTKAVPAKTVPVKKAVAKKAVAPNFAAPGSAGPDESSHAEPSVPAGTAQAPTAAVKEAAAATELPPVKKATKRAAAKKTAPKSPEA
ncbi:phasin family protein [Micromonosporaceae bacterium Da 78-11]